ncbi:P-loop containing nucleoside triphosphate hydrolase protein [Dioscorea alata]|uniref:P-loop containing nucleoside triphosphate hydrolase protein n=1 Tax=Dioscorea alata TaxID=55571 RepID=A0ACB7WLB0_DIOAL|nr:P-loop containing nucleoside triphosphate hydrolase protein [Dioscorea alata]
MADFVVSLVVSKLEGLLTQELSLLYGVRDEVEWVERELRWIKCFLKDADAKGKRNERVKAWMDHVIRLAYDAENAIDTFLIKVHQSKGGLTCINRFKPSVLIAERRLGLALGNIKERLIEIKAMRQIFGIENLGGDGDALNLMPVRRLQFLPVPLPDEADVFRRFNDEEILLKRLLMNHHGQQQKICVISIVGIGGLGKSTLAQKLYCNNVVRQYFEIRIWVTVSQEDSLMGLLRKMLQQVPFIEKDELERMGENYVIDKLNDSLRARRFLIVLDDLWHEDVCIHIQRSFPDGNYGSRILITTRFLNVARRADPTSTPYQLQLLNEDESMKLLLKKAFPNEDVDLANCSSELLDIGRRLVRKCGGLPLALVELAGLLCFKDKTPAVWRRVLEAIDWGAEDNDCQKVLALSYEDLPSHMKLCFLYLGAYPEDYEISCNVLIRQWVAEGFIPQEREKTMEETGEAILEELSQRCLIHVKTRKSNGIMKKCGVHVLLLHLARSQAEKDRFLTVCSTQNDQPISLLALSRRVAIHNINDIRISEINQMHGLRSLMVFAPTYDSIATPMFKFQLLRVLDLIGFGFQKRLPKEIKLMIHLRYLRMQDTVVSVIPSSIGNLQCLQMIGFPRVTGIPITVWKIKTLRHVLLQQCTPPQSVKLEDLLTLDTVTFGSHETINWSFPNLRKLKLVINKERHGAMLNHLLSELGHLISLHIRAENRCHIEIDTTKDFPFHNHLLSLILHGPWPKGGIISEFPINLTKIELHDSGLQEDPMPKLERLQYLVTLKFFGNVYLGENMACSAGGFPSLEYLFINGNSVLGLEEWSIEEGAMSKLTFLRLTSCKQLKMLPSLQHVISLQTLELVDMSQELMLRSKDETGVDWYKIQAVPKITFEE